MTYHLKQYVPLFLRMSLKWMKYAVLDVVKGKTPKRVPPRRHIFIGGGDFIEIGEAFFNILKRHGLTPDMDVLDVGCGQGRLARPMVGYFNSGSYQGFDIGKPGIEWCEKEYSDVPEFEFRHADVYNKRYNKTGKIAAKDYRFPFADDSFDFVFLTSVFTHMFTEDIEAYLGEIARVLRPNGICLITWFLLDEVSRKNRDHVYNFASKIDAVSRTTVAKNPEAAIAFDLDFVRQLYVHCDLKIEKIEYGRWARANSKFEFQDLIVASK